MKCTEQMLCIFENGKGKSKRGAGIKEREKKQTTKLCRVMLYEFRVKYIRVNKSSNLNVLRMLRRSMAKRLKIAGRERKNTTAQMENIENDVYDGECMLCSVALRANALIGRRRSERANGMKRANRTKQPANGMHAHTRNGEEIF